MDQLKLAHDLLALARAKHARIAVAESCTGGLVAGAITRVAGASDIFELGLVTYSNDAKVAMLGVAPATIEQFGAVSPEVAREMAQGALAHGGANIALSVTGVAGPGGSAHKPEGRVCFALARPGHAARSETIEFGAIGRTQVRAGAVDHALKMLIAALGLDLTT